MDMIFDIAKDLLDSTTSASSNGVDKTSDKGTSATKPALIRRGSSGVATNDGKEAEKQHPNSRRIKKRTSMPKGRRRISIDMVDVLTGEFLDDDGEDRNDKE